MEKIWQEQISLFPKSLNQAVNHLLPPTPSPDSPSLLTPTRVMDSLCLAQDASHGYAAALGRLAETQLEGVLSLIHISEPTRPHD